MAVIKSPKKLIEVALPLDDINAAAAREKSIRHGHPSTLHLWWARRPLAAARAVLFAQLVNDPSDVIPGDKRRRDVKEKVERKREELFQIIRELVQWENTNNEAVLNRAREAIWESWRETCRLNRNHSQAAELFNPEKLPAFHDPFAGGGAIPLEAQRLGLESYASDLNPVAVMINKAMIEIPPKFAGRKPVGPLPAGEKQAKLMEDWSGARGLAEDVRRYGHWMREEAFKRIGHLYPKVTITPEMVAERPDLKPYQGEELTVIAWLWARTVKSPNPAFSNVNVPLVSSFMLASKPGKEAYIEPKVTANSYEFKVCRGKPLDLEATKAGTKAPGKANFRCILSNALITKDYIKSQGELGGVGERMMAIVAEGKRERVYLSPTKEYEILADRASPGWRPLVELSRNSRHMSPRGYGFRTWDRLFTNRQLSAIEVLCQLVGEAGEECRRAALDMGWGDDEKSIDDGGVGAKAYGDAVSLYLAFFLSRLINLNNGLCQWRSDPAKEHVGHMFARQAVPIVWDFAEANPLGPSAGGFDNTFGLLPKVFDFLPSTGKGSVVQVDARAQEISTGKVVSSDPPYYDNVPYADLSDFFYVWLRRAIGPLYKNLFATISTPKDDELVADATRQGGKNRANEFFLSGMSKAISAVVQKSHPALPVTLYYAFKQSDLRGDDVSSSGWEVFLEAIIGAGAEITGTWPVRTELANRTRGAGANALASSVVLVCRKREAAAETISRREFQRRLRDEMPDALETMIGGETGQTPIAPVDLAQAAIGPGMAIFSQYAAVLNQDGSPMSVHDALVLINRAITEYLSPDSGNFDADTQFCSSWFDQYGWSTGPFGEADTLARAKGTSVDGVREAGVVESGGGKVRLLKWAEYEADWDPLTDKRLPIWEACHQMIRRLNNQGETAAGELLAKMPDKGEPIRQLAYHLYTLCERKKWAEEARAYNELIASWHTIVAASHAVGHSGQQQGLDF